METPLQFDWDTNKSDWTLENRGFDFEFASRIFAGVTVENIDDRFDYGEERIGAFGEVEGIVLFVVYTDRADKRRIISARLASSQEREKYHACKT